ncbi:hypothetical protein [Dyadobacter sp. SG02]|uniref:hypothetical protein n=1 Tax=Dyadobacter sp. SG02 TaxID=1855291 RepID=UPI0015A53D2E|nr:hypothetical protein [Dyadobacter sp. SG02]
MKSKNAYLGLPFSHSKPKPRKMAGMSRALPGDFDELVAILEKKAKKRPFERRAT